MKKFLTEEWRADYEPAVKDIFSAGKTPSKINQTLCEVYNEVPQLDGKDFWYFYEFKDGVIVTLTCGFGVNTAPAADYTSFGDYETVKKIMTKELGIPRALMSGKVKLKGNVTKALKMLDTYNRVQDAKELGGQTEW